MRAFLIANDAGESLCLQSIHKELLKRKNETFSIFGNGRHLKINQSDIAAMLWADVFIATISNDNEAEVGLAQIAREKNPNTHIVIYAPGSYAFQLKGTEPLREIVNLLLISNEEEVKKAQALYPNTRVESIGNILYEKDAVPTLTTEDAQKIVGFIENRKFIFVPGDKTESVNWPLFHSVIEAAHQKQVLQHYPAITIGLHPGTTPTIETAVKEIEIYRDIEKFSRKVPVKIFTKFSVPSSVLVTACDLMVTARSSLAVHAIYQRKPVIGLFFELMLANTEIGANKQFEWEPGIKKAARVIRNGSIEQLGTEMNQLLAYDSPILYEMRQNQQKNYPEPPKLGSIAKKAVDLIEQLLIQP
ncbi:MAG TPA: hypothetical protein VJH05_01095 [Candidatus Paceibacterota bacterium]